MATKKLHGILAYSGLLIVLYLIKLFPQYSFVAGIYMVLPLLFMEDKKLGFKNYKKGFLYGLFGLPLFIYSLPSLTCLAWVLNQLGIAVAEEIFFRGFLMNFFNNITVSFMFMLAHLIHFPTINSLLVFFPSLIFGYVYIKSGSIVAPVLLHFFSNLFFFAFIKEFPELHEFLSRNLTGS